MACMLDRNTVLTSAAAQPCAATIHPSTDDATIMCSNLTYCSVAELYPVLCEPTDCSMPGFSVLHSLPMFAQTHVRWVADGIQPSHPLSPPSPPALNFSFHEYIYICQSSCFCCQSQRIVPSVALGSLRTFHRLGRDWSILSRVLEECNRIMHHRFQKE